MATLTRDALERAGSFIERNARPLERARFDCLFDGGSADRVLAALALFQNPDGGFGRALEPDLRAPESSALCTSVAFQVIRRLDTPRDNTIVRRALEYLISQWNGDTGAWRIIPASADASPRAPWWYQEGREAQFDAFSLNPAAEILGYLYDYRDRVPDEMLVHVNDGVFAELERAGHIEMHDLLCCLRLLQTATLPSSDRERLYRRLDELVSGTVSRDPAEWAGYSLRPLQVASHPDSPFAVQLADAVALNLDFEIASQSSEGSWEPTWAWDDRYPAEWSVARREWAGVLTIEKLETLKRFGRIEGLIQR